ncbi:MAG: hypothetical protein IPM17_12605 [Verrucomicrobia bacterium]|nr:hypothetical protein [Verrucomicrobiota bacterium]
MSDDSRSRRRAGTGDSSAGPAPSAGEPTTRRPRLPLAPALFLLGLGTLLLSWLGFMGYYVFVKAKQPQPIPEVRMPAGPATNSPLAPNEPRPKL